MVERVLPVLGAQVAGLEHVGLLYDLARIAQKLGAVVGECNTAARARKDFDMKFLL